MENMKVLWYLTVMITLDLNACESTDENSFYARKKCKTPLLRDMDKVPNSAFRSSTNWNRMNASMARLDPRDDAIMDAWCPKNFIVPNKFDEWLEVDLGALHLITIIQTMGRKALHQGREFTPEYRVAYKRDLSESQFRIYKKKDKTDILKGNDDVSHPSINELEHAFVARVVRIYPNHGENQRHVCMKLELIGCLYEDNLVEYSIPQGDLIMESESGNLNFIDDTYDGNEVSQHENGDQPLLKGGLGKLTDNCVENVALKKHDAYVGWQGRSDREKVTFFFRFLNLRNFSFLHLYAANAFRSRVRLPKRIVVSFSTNGETFLHNHQVNHTLSADSHLESPRWLKIRLNHQAAKLLLVDLYFDDRVNKNGILLSEVMFSSDFLVKNALPFKESIANLGVNRPTIVHVDEVVLSSTLSSSVQMRVSKSVIHPPLSASPNEKNKSIQDSEIHYIAIIVGCLVGVVILLVLIAVIWIRRRRCHKKQQHIHGISVAAMKDNGQLHLDFHNGHPIMSVNGKSLHTASIYTSLPNSEDDEIHDHVTSPLNGESDLISLLNAGSKPTHCAGVAFGQMQEYTNTTILNKQFATKNSPSSQNPIVAGLAINSAMANTLGDSHSLHGGYAKPQISPNTSDLIDIVSPYSTTSLTSSGLTNFSLNAPPSLGMLYKNSSHQPLPCLKKTFASNVSIEGVSGTTLYAVPDEKFDVDHRKNLPTTDISMLEVNRFQLDLQDKLGEGQFGEVFLARIRPSISSGKFQQDHSKTHLLPGMQVAVKMLRCHVSEQAKSDFYKEMQILARLNDQHIVRVLGVITTSEPLCVLVEYMKYGDLHQFLRGKISPPPTEIRKSYMASTLPSRNQAGLSYGCLLYMAAQIASGMKYMENLNMVHRDLAARNCLVGSQYQIKISDFGMSRSLYSNDYYRIEGRVILPIRWMAWESVLFGNFSPKSDIWAFGVTLWEILNYCSVQPYSHLTDAEVIRNCGHIYANDGFQEWLPCPSDLCPREIYDLMRECWNREETARPNFHEIHMFLQRKTMGYNTMTEDYFKTGSPSAAMRNNSLASSPNCSPLTPSVQKMQGGLAFT